MKCFNELISEYGLGYKLKNNEHSTLEQVMSERIEAYVSEEWTGRVVGETKFVMSLVNELLNLRGRLTIKNPEVFSEKFDLVWDTEKTPKWVYGCIKPVVRITPVLSGYRLQLWLEVKNKSLDILNQNNDEEFNNRLIEGYKLKKIFEKEKAEKELGDEFLIQIDSIIENFYTTHSDDFDELLTTTIIKLIENGMEKERNQRVLRAVKNV